MTDLIRRKSPGEAWESVSDSGGGGGGVTAISIDAQDVATYQTFGPFDSQGVNSLSLLLELFSFDDTATRFGNMIVLSRKTGMPWMPCLLAVTADGVFNWNIHAAAQLQYEALPVCALGVFDETIVYAFPSNTGDGGVSSFSTSFGGGEGDFTIAPSAKTTAQHSTLGDLFSITLIDPGDADVPLSIASPDGYEMQITLQTDGGAIIVSTVADLLSATNPFYLGITQDNPGLVQALSQEFLAGGDEGNVTATFTVTGSY